MKNSQEEHYQKYKKLFKTNDPDFIKITEHDDLLYLKDFIKETIKQNPESNYFDNNLLLLKAIKSVNLKFVKFIVNNGFYSAPKNNDVQLTALKNNNIKFITLLEPLGFSFSSPQIFSEFLNSNKNQKENIRHVGNNIIPRYKESYPDWQEHFIKDSLTHIEKPLDNQHQKLFKQILFSNPCLDNILAIFELGILEPNQCKEQLYLYLSRNSFEDSIYDTLKSKYNFELNDIRYLSYTTDTKKMRDSTKRILNNISTDIFKDEKNSHFLYESISKAADNDNYQAIDTILSFIEDSVPYLSINKTKLFDIISQSKKTLNYQAVNSLVKCFNVEDDEQILIDILQDSISLFVYYSDTSNKRFNDDTIMYLDNLFNKIPAPVFEKHDFFNDYYVGLINKTKERSRREDGTTVDFADKLIVVMEKKLFSYYIDNNKSVPQTKRRL